MKRDDGIHPGSTMPVTGMESGAWCHRLLGCRFPVSSHRLWGGDGAMNVQVLRKNQKSKEGDATMIQEYSSWCNIQSAAGFVFFTLSLSISLSLSLSLCVCALHKLRHQYRSDILFDKDYICSRLCSGSFSLRIRVFRERLQHQQTFRQRKIKKTKKKMKKKKKKLRKKNQTKIQNKRNIEKREITDGEMRSLFWFLNNLLRIIKASARNLRMHSFCDEFSGGDRKRERGKRKKSENKAESSFILFIYFHWSIYYYLEGFFSWITLWLIGLSGVGCGLGSDSYDESYPKVLKWCLSCPGW